MKILGIVVYSLSEYALLGLAPLELTKEVEEHIEEWVLPDLKELERDIQEEMDECEW